MLRKMLVRMEEGRHPPTHGAIFFDPPREDSWRRAFFPDYKAHRPPMDPALAAQVGEMKDLAGRMGLAQATAPRHEADDMIAAYVADARARGDRVSILSRDKDLLQLVQPGVMQYDAISEKWYRSADVEEKFGVRPDQIGDFLALAGDKSDGIPGVPGIGPVAAGKLLLRFGTLSDLLGRLDEIERISWRQRISENRETARISRVLVSLDAEGAPRPLSCEAMRMPSASEADAALRAWRAQV